MEKLELLDIIDRAILNALRDVHTMVVCEVVQVNEKTVNVRPVIRERINEEWDDLATFTQVPPIFMRGGSSREEWPIAVGDSCLVLISERCFDRWYGGENHVQPPDLRMHDYSDGFALVGLFPSESAPTIPDIIRRIGDMFHSGDLEHEGSTTQTGDYTQTGNQTQEGSRSQTGNQDIDGDQSITGNQEAATYSVGGQSGASGTFLSQDGFSVTVVNGIVTEIA